MTSKHVHAYIGLYLQTVGPLRLKARKFYVIINGPVSCVYTYFAHRRTRRSRQFPG